MKPKFKNHSGVRPQEYEVIVNGALIGAVRKRQDSYSGMGMGTYTTWTATLPSGEYVERTNIWDKTFRPTRDLAQRTKFDTRAQAAEALAIMAGIEVG